MGHAAIVGPERLNKLRPAADKGSAVAFNLPLVLIPVPVLVIGLLLAVGAF
jgi:hypothetical protein